MGWKGTIRAIGAANRRSIRASDRRRREIDKYRKEEAKHHARLSAEMEAEDYALHVEQLRSMHTDCGPVTDWHAVASEREPAFRPPPSIADEAFSRAMNYEPSFLDKMLRRADSVRERLHEEAVASRRLDAEATQKAEAEHRRRVADWEERRDFARRILAGDAEAEMELIQESNPFEEIAFLGSRAEVRKSEGKPHHVHLFARGSEVIPSEVKSVTQAGKLSVKKMPVGQFQELFQDYICGGAFRVAREMFALLPVDEVLVTAYAEMLNPASGHVEDTPVLSARFMRATLARLNFDRIDPSDALSGVQHVMDFRKTKGFAAVTPLA